VINMDMMATVNTSDPTVLLEGASLSQHLIDALAEAAAAFTTLTVRIRLSITSGWTAPAGRLPYRLRVHGRHRHRGRPGPRRCRMIWSLFNPLACDPVLLNLAIDATERFQP
jgi:hypothetical protein